MIHAACRTLPTKLDATNIGACKLHASLTERNAIVDRSTVPPTTCRYRSAAEAQADTKQQRDRDTQAEEQPLPGSGNAEIPVLPLASARKSNRARHPPAGRRDSGRGADQ